MAPVVPEDLRRWQDAIMDTLAISLKPFELRLLVNGRDLIELVAEVEGPLARADKQSGRRQGVPNHRGLPPLVVLPPARHFLDEPVQGWTRHDKTYLLGCSCGTPEC